MQGRPLRPGVVIVPAGTYLDDAVIRWSYLEYGGKEKKPPPDLLNRFIRLADAKPEHICGFAQKWGVLGFCEHGLPHTHNSGLGHGDNCMPQGHGEGKTLSENAWCWDEVDQWRRLARRFGSTLKIAVQLENSRTVGDLEDWQRLGLGGVYPPKPNDARYLLAQDTSSLVQLGAVTPRMIYQKGGWVLIHQAHGIVNLFGILAFQAMLAISRTDGLATCSACGESYVVTGRRPNPKRRSYCPTCGKRAADRDAARDYRRRKGKTS